MAVFQFSPEAERILAGEFVISIILFAIFFSLAWLYQSVDWQLARAETEHPTRIP